MHSQDKIKSELIKDLQKLQQEYDSLKASYSKGITERKLAEDKLHDSSDDLYRLLNSMSEGAYGVDINGNCIFVNLAFLKILGYKNDYEVLGKHIHELIHHSHNDGSPYPSSECIMSRVSRTNQPINVSDEVFWRKDGVAISVEYWSHPIIKDGVVVGALATFIDITDRKEAEVKLRSSEEKLKILFDYAPNAYFLNDLNGNIIDGNIAAEKLTGYDRNELIGKSFLKLNLLSLKQITRAAKLLKEHSLAQSTGPDEFVINRKDGSKVTIEIISHSVKIKDKTLVLAMARDVTEHNKADKALKESEERFRSLYENSTVGIYRTTQRGKILLANPTLVKILGYSSFEELSGRNLEEDGFEQSYERTHFLDVMNRNGEVKGLESVWTKKDGTRLFITESARAIKDQKGKIKFYEGIVEDITQRKQAEDDLKESEERFRSLMENSADAIFLTDKGGHYVYTNKAVTILLGFSQEEMKSKTIIDLTPPGRIDEYLKQFSQLINEGKLFTELDLVKKNGEIISTDFNAALFPGDLVYGSCRDITERKVIQNELLKHRNHLEELVNERTEKLRTVMEETRDLYENAPCGYHSLDENGRFIRINNTELKWLGYSRDEVIGKLEFKDLMTPASLEKFSETFPVFMKQGEISNLEFEFIRKDGSTFFVSLNAAAIYDADGKFLKSRSTLFDITDRKLAEEALSKAKKEAENANMAKSEFLANMSHEIRTPMNAVLGYTELLENTLVDQTQKDYISSIKSSGRSLLTLINDILDLSKIEAGKLDLEYDFIDTYSFFSEFEKIFSLRVSEKELKFILDISSGTPQGIYIDEARVRQIVFNLIGNAIKFTSEGKIVLKVFTENPQIVRYSKDKSEELIDLIIEVQDTGIGISKVLQEAIFEPFVQERNFRHYGGTGLGLTISRRLTELMDGTILVRSEPGKGSIFTVRIPEIAYQRAFSGTKIDIHINPAEIEFEKAVILIADDVEHNRNYIRDALKNTRLKIVEAEDGISAYKIAEEIVPDLIITDIRMPKMDGFQLLNKMKADKKLKHIPVIAYSASVLKAQKERIHNSEFAGLLIKPVKVTELYLELMNILPYKSIRELEHEKLPSEVYLIGEITNLPELINSLESDLYTTWETFAIKQPIGGIRDFGSNLVQLGTHHNSSIIKDYGKDLMDAADNYNIVAILKLIGKYSGIIENLKDSTKNNRQ